MALEYAIESLYASGWSALDTRGCSHVADGRAVPSVQRVAEEFESKGYALRLQYVQLFDCYRAQWMDGAGGLLGAVVGQSETETAVYALSQLRRSLMGGEAHSSEKAVDTPKPVGSGNSCVPEANEGAA
jgi:hypothetical protein